MASQNIFDRGIIYIGEEPATMVELDEYDVYLMIYLYRLYTLELEIYPNKQEPFSFFPSMPGTPEKSNTVNGSKTLLKSLKKLYDTAIFKNLSLHLHENYYYVGVFNFDESKILSITDLCHSIGDLLAPDGKNPFPMSVEEKVDQGALLEIMFEIDSQKLENIFKKIISEYRQNQSSWPLTSGDSSFQELGPTWRKQLLTLKNSIQKIIKEDPYRGGISISLASIPASVQLPEATLCLLFDKEYRKEGYDINVIFFDMYPVSLEIQYNSTKSQSRKSSRRKKSLYYDKEEKIIYVDQVKATKPLANPKFQSGNKRTTFQVEELFLKLYQNLGCKIGYEDIIIETGRGKDVACYDAYKAFQKKITLPQGKKKKLEMIEIIHYGAGTYWIDSDIFEIGVKK